LISQRQFEPSRVNALILGRQAVLKFENDLRSQGVNPDLIVQEQMKRNPRVFLQEVEKAIDPKVEDIMTAALNRLGIKKTDGF
jgi:hypothetical protein